MGISLRDFASFAEGAIERDRELTKEDFEIRNANLAANRDMLIKQKEKKYEKELENYYAEKEKFDSIKSANAMFKDGQINDRAYASQILTLTMPNFASLDNDSKESLINNFKGKTIDYSLKGSIDEINKNAAAEQTAINDATVAAIKEAKGDSFLINKILRKKGVDDKKLLDDIQTKINAAETVDLTEQKVDPSTVGLDVEVGGSSEMSDLMSKFLKNKNSDKYQTEWAKQRDKISYNPLKDENGIRFLNTAANLGGSDELSFKYNATDQKISGLNSPAFIFADSMKYFFNGVKDSNDTMVKHYYTVTPLHGDISKTWNEENIYSQVESLIESRSGNIKEDPFGGGGKIRLTTIVPLSIVGLDVQADKNSLKTLNKVMNDYIIKETKDRYQIEKGNKTYQQIANNVYSEIYRGDNKDAINSILENYNTLVSNKKETTNTPPESSSTVIDNKPKDDKPKITYTVAEEGGKEGLVINGKFNTWEAIEKANAVNDLPPEQQKLFSVWKATNSPIELTGNEAG